MYKTFVYSPEVRVVIEGVDVSADIVSGSLNRVVDGASSFTLRLSNKDFRYTRYHQFRRMDRIVVWMKRVGSPLKVFTGYLNVVPGIQLYPATVQLEASCTIKRLLYTYWDPGLEASRQILDQSRIPWGKHPEGGVMSGSDSSDSDEEDEDENAEDATPSDEVGGGLNPILDSVDLPDLEGDPAVNGMDGGLSDSGLGMMLYNVLVLAGGWNEEEIKIQAFPETFFKTILAYMPDDINGMHAAGMEKIRDLFDFYEKIQGSGGGGASGELGPITASQIEHAKEIRRSAKDNGLDPLDDACIIGYMVALQESGIRILANHAVPESLNMPNEGIGGDHDSVGIFQQRQAGWGTLEERMNAYASANMFYARLKTFDWQSMPKGAAGQKVQVSAHPSAYDKWEAQAESILAQVKGEDPDTKGAEGDKPSGGKGAAAGASAGAKAGTSGASKDTSKEKDSQGPDTSGMRIFESIAAVASYKFPSIEMTSGERYTDNGYHSKLMAADMAVRGVGNAGHPDMVELAYWWYDNFMGKGLLELIHRPFDKNVISDTDYGTGSQGPGNGYSEGTMEQHRDHVHIAMDGVVSADGTTAGGGSGSRGGAAGGNIQWENKLAKNLFTYMFDSDRFNDAYSEILTGKHASLNDEPIINMVKTICDARMSHFQSAPDGKFLCFYPDYFGLDGTAPHLVLEDVEVKDLTISINDNALTTHVFTVGATGMDPGNVIPGMEGYMTSPGVVTVEDEWLFKLATSEMYFPPEFDSADEMMARYGIRPFRGKQYSNINSETNPAAMLVVAIKVFMERWAQQYHTNIQLTFMPELFPGMRIHLTSHSLVVYVEQVSHNFDYNSGFSTTARVMAPMQPRSQAERDALWLEILRGAENKEEEAK